MEGMIPVKRFYKVIAIAILITNPLAYFAGEQQGDTNCHLEQATVSIKNQKRVYENDLQVDKDTPDPASNEWVEWMRDAIPIFSD